MAEGRGTGWGWWWWVRGTGGLNGTKDSAIGTLSSLYYYLAAVLHKIN